MQSLREYVALKKKYYDKLNINSITDNKWFWKTFCQKTFLPIFYLKAQKLEKGETVTDHTKIVETFNTFFSDVIKALNIEKNERITCNAGQKSSILQVIKECSIDLTIVRIKNQIKNPITIFFRKYIQNLEKAIAKLDPKNFAPQNDIAVKILKLNIDFVILPDDLKLADIILV